MRTISGVALALAVLLGIATGSGATEARQSGTIAAVRPDGFTIEVIGSWTGPGTGLERHDVKLGPETDVRLVQRIADVQKAAWPSAFSSTPLTASALRPGEFVTVTRQPAASDVAAVVEVFAPAQ